MTERLWVTDNERIEQVVYDLHRAVEASDVKGVFAYLTPDIEYVLASAESKSGDETRAFIRDQLEHTKFDFVRITNLEAHAGGQTGRGSVEFRVLTSGTHDSPFATLNFGATHLDFSLGFQETEPHVWKVDRITPTQVPRLMPRPSASIDSGGYQSPLRFPGHGFRGGDMPSWKERHHGRR